MRSYSNVCIKGAGLAGLTLPNPKSVTDKLTYLGTRWNVTTIIRTHQLASILKKAVPSHAKNETAAGFPSGALHVPSFGASQCFSNTSKRRSTLEMFWGRELGTNKF